MTTPDSVVIQPPRIWSDWFRRAGVAVSDGLAWPESGVTAVTDDSRAVISGSCFVAVRGTEVDGHSFIADAAAAGATVIVVDQDVAVPNGVVRVRVNDSREALAKLAAAFHGLRGEFGSRLRLVGVTGTNGKTTITWMLRSILQAAGESAAMIGTVEYDLVARRCRAPMTTPGPVDLCRYLAEARDAGATYAALEVSSHALDQRRCDGLSFAAGVFTNLTGDHLDYHGTMEAYGAAKRRLFDLLDGDGAAIVHLNDPMGASLARTLDCHVVTYGLGNAAPDVTARMVRLDHQGADFVLGARSFETSVRLSLPGEHNVANALAAAATAEVLGIDSGAIRAGLERLTAVPGRFQRVEPDGWPFSVLVDFAHTDAALASALSALRPLTRGRLICVFGCGGDRDRSKRPRMAAAVGRFADVAFVTSDNPRSEDPERIIEDILPGFDPASACRIEVEVDRRRAIEAAITEARPTDTVLIAGKGHETYQLVGDWVLPFDDVAVARSCLAASRSCLTAAQTGEEVA